MLYRIIFLFAALTLAVASSIRPAKYPNMCLYYKGSKWDLQGAAAIRKCRGGGDENWHVRKDGVIQLAGTDWCLSPITGYADASIVTKGCPPMGSGRMVWKNDGITGRFRYADPDYNKQLCLDNERGLGKDGNPAHMWGCNRNNINQKWIVR